MIVVCTKQKPVQFSFIAKQIHNRSLKFAVCVRSKYKTLNSLLAKIEYPLSNRIHTFYLLNLFYSVVTFQTMCNFPHLRQCFLLGAIHARLLSVKKNRPFL